MEPAAASPLQERSGDHEARSDSAPHHGVPVACVRCRRSGDAISRTPVMPFVSRSDRVRRAPS